MKKFVRLISLVMAVSLALMMVAMAGACNHVWTKWTTKIPPTCLEEGEQESSCDKHARKRSTVSMVAMMKEESCSRILLRLQPAYSVLNVPSAALKRGHWVNTILYLQIVCSLKYAQSVLFRQKN